MEFISHSEKGINKSENQDNFVIIQEDKYHLFALFDGVGSALNSREATNLAVSTLHSKHRSFLRDNSNLAGLMLECNRQILLSNLSEGLSTYCALLIPNSKNKYKSLFSSLGDTRIYNISNQYIEQLSIDDRSDSHKNAISKCLGMSSLSEKDFIHREIIPTSSSFLLCTDGFYSHLELDRLFFFKIINGKNINSVKDHLITSIKGKNNDDASFILVRQYV